MTPSSCRIAVIGAGPAGLALAVHLQQAGADFQVFESQERSGGNVRSEPRDGYLCEWGPNGFLDNEPATLRMVEILGLQEQLVAANPMSEKRWIVRKGKLRQMPQRPLQFLFGDVLSPVGRVRAGLEWAQPQRRDPADESVFDFARRRVGREAAEVLVDAMVTGIYAGDSRKLSLRSTLPRMAELESNYGGLFRAMRALKQQKKHGGGSQPPADTTPSWHKRRPATPMGPSGVLHSFANGMQTLTDSMAHHLGSRLHIGSPLRGIHKMPAGWQLQFASGNVTAQSLVLSCPAWSSAPLLHDTDPDLALELAGIHSAPVVVVCTGFAETDVERVDRGFGFLIPGRENSPVLGTLFDTWVFPNRSRVGNVLFRTLLGGARHPEVLQANDADLIDASRESLKRLLGLDAPAQMTHVIRHARGIAQYNLGHGERLERIEERRLQHTGLWLTGNCYRGVAMNYCIREAESLAQSLCQTTHSGSTAP